MKKAVFMLMFAALLMGGCANMEPSIAPAVNVGETDPNFVSIDEALTSADDLFAVMFGNSTRSGRKVRNVETFRPRISTRSNSGDEMYGFYIVNYDNDGGFAMVSADRRRTPVQAISDEGSLQLSDTLTNEGLNWYMNHYLKEVEASNWGNFYPIQPVDTLFPVSPIAPPSVQRKNIICEPMLTGFMREFHQGSPYNKYCFTSSFEQGLVGCGPLSVGVAISFYETPQQIGDCSFDWKKMKQNRKHDSWGMLFRKLGDNNYLNADYKSPNATSIVPNRIPPTLKSLGYGNISIGNFDTSKLHELLRNGKLGICGGYADDGSGHGWLIDGGYEYYQESPPVDKGGDPLITSTYYYHCVWGYGGDANGYFSYRTGMGGTPFERDPNTGGSVDYFKDMYLIYGFK